MLKKFIFIICICFIFNGCISFKSNKTNITVSDCGFGYLDASENERHYFFYQKVDVANAKNKLLESQFIVDGSIANSGLLIMVKKNPLYKWEDVDKIICDTKIESLKSLKINDSSKIEDSVKF